MEATKEHIITFKPLEYIPKEKPLPQGVKALSEILKESLDILEEKARRNYTRASA